MTPDLQKLIAKAAVEWLRNGDLVDDPDGIEDAFNEAFDPPTVLAMLGELDRLAAALKAEVATEHRVCDGCGTSHHESEFAAPGPPYSCCPERKMLTAKEWRDRYVAEVAARERAEEALRFYAENWEYVAPRRGLSRAVPMKALFADQGEIARAALAHHAKVEPQ